MSDNHFCQYFRIVRLTGLEPARRETPDPKSGASTNSATGAKERSVIGPSGLKRVQRYEKKLIPPKVFVQILSAYLFLDRNHRRFGRRHSRV